MSKSIVYTAFDGDYLTHISMMQEYVIMMGQIPLNPEHALGYYISTRSHGDKKTEVMKDCLSLVRISDKLWIFIDQDDEQFDWSSLPEGIVIELIFWCFLGKKEVTIVTINKVLESFHKGRQDYQGIKRTVNIDDIVLSFTKEHFDEMTQYLQGVLTYLRPVTMIDIKDVDFKYADWVRMEAYRQGKVPLVPQNVFPEWMYVRYGKSEEYAIDLQTVSIATQLIWAIYRSRAEILSLKKQYANCRESIQITYIPVQKFGIPKYSDPSSWSITTQEYHENVEILGETGKS